MLPQRPAGFQYEPLLVLAVPASEFLGQREKGAPSGVKPEQVRVSDHDVE